MINSNKTPIILLILLLLFTAIQELTAQSVKLDKQLGAEAAMLVVEQMGIYENESLTAYVEEIGQQLVAQLENRKFDYQFLIVDDITPNAFALPGGYVYVTRGLLGLVNNSSELACVLGHEVIHVHNRHSIKQMRKGIIPSILEFPGKLIGATVSESLGNTLNAPITTGKKLIMSKYSRNHEYEADEGGIALATLAGYNPTVLGGILDRIISWEETLTLQQEQQSYFSDHPYTPKRIARLEELTANLNWKNEQAKDKVALDELEGMLFWDNPNKGMFEKHVFIHRDLDFRIEFPVDWQYQNQASMVSATNPEDGSFVHLRLADTTKSAKKHGQEFVKKLKKQRYDLQMKSGKLDVGGKPAYLITMLEDVNGTTVEIAMIWIEMGDFMFKLVAVSTGEIFEQFEHAFKSLRPLTAQEKEGIKEFEISLVTAKNERIDELNERTDNQLREDLLAKLNGVTRTEFLKPGQKIKIVTEKK